MNTFAAACFGVMVLALCLTTQVDCQVSTAAPTANMSTPDANQTTPAASANVTTVATNTFSSAANVTTPSRADPALQPAIYFILLAIATSFLHCC
ncbi:hypothetical protein COCON_G00093330 [Conger conger]|uniref:Uncharacterized protein n=1 Tax=Conger conger TaxID=82655 RepID=A0A9Q1DLG8_CONCO|nr:hypothetical protein COCON_G00093330 [Conger conger]